MKECDGISQTLEQLASETQSMVFQMHIESLEIYVYYDTILGNFKFLPLLVIVINFILILCSVLLSKFCKVPRIGQFQSNKVHEHKQIPDEDYNVEFLKAGLSPFIYLIQLLPFHSQIIPSLSAPSDIGIIIGVS